MEPWSCVWVVFLLLGFSGVHSSNSHKGEDVKCFSCSRYSSEFPRCLTHTAHTCYNGYRCHLRYDPKRVKSTEVGCWKHCTVSSNTTTDTNCPHGGEYIDRQHACDTCCSDDACVDRVTQGLTAVQDHTTQLLCPGHCNVNNLAHCVSTAKPCAKGQYCDLKITQGTSVTGTCTPVANQPACEQLKVNLPCSGGLSAYVQNANALGQVSQCTWDCCASNACLAKIFPSFSSTPLVATPSSPPATTPTTTRTTTTTTPSSTSTITPTTTTTTTPATSTSMTTPTPTTPPPSTNTPTATTATRPPTSTTTSTTRTTTALPLASTTALVNISQQLTTYCQDQLISGMCQTLVSQRNVCRDALDQLLCAETCGICQAIREARCRDTVLHNGCLELKAKHQVCQDSLAIYTCPETCGMCGLVVKDILKQFQTGQRKPPSSALG